MLFRSILTIEDPIEFLFKHKKSIVNQRELGMDTHGWGQARKVVRGMEVVRTIGKVDCDLGDRPLVEVVMKKVTIIDELPEPEA